VTVTEVINHPHAAHPFLFQALDDCNFVVRLAKPSIVIVQFNRATAGRRQLHDLANSFRLLLRALRLFGFGLRRTARSHDPQLRMNAVALDDFQNGSRVRIPRIGWKPPGRQMDAVFVLV
jgi:hypothetical protein